MPRHDAAAPWSDSDFQPVAALIRARRQAGGMLSPQRLGLIRAKLQARLVARGVPSFAWFHEHELVPRPDGPGMQLLIDLTTVNHSTFFREPVTLRAVAEHVAGLIAARPPLAGPVRVWSAGCSAGQEAYSLAILVAESVPSLARERLEILGSDLALGVVRAAARAIYEDRELADVPDERLRRSFLRGHGPREGTYRVAPEIRALASFLQFDLRRPDWPVPAEFDVILCRNVAIYFEEGERPALLDRLASRLRDGGWLVVGNCEILPERPGVLRKIAPSIFRRASAP